jgi:uncharacterized Zn finger protein
MKKERIELECEKCGSENVEIEQRKRVGKYTARYSTIVQCKDCFDRHKEKMQ